MSFVAAMVDLEQRAGASDLDRPAWLAERRPGITATEIRDLMVHKVSEQRLIDMKLGRKPESDWTGPYAAYGKEREPVIAAEVQRRWNIAPETRLFHHPINPRYMCSPDGIGVQFDEEVIGGEYKTSEEDLSPWEPLFSKLGYDLQCQWCMWVTGANKWLFVWEERYGTPGEFWPGEMHFYWIDRDDKVIDRMVERARRFLFAYDEAAAAPWVGDQSGIDEELDTHAVNYLRFLAEEKAAAEAKKREYAAITAAGRSQTSTLARITYTPPTPVEVEEIDYTGARATTRGAELHQRLVDAQHEWDAYLAEKFTTISVAPGIARARITVPSLPNPPKMKGSE